MPEITLSQFIDAAGGRQQILPFGPKQRKRRRGRPLDGGRGRKRQQRARRGALKKIGEPTVSVILHPDGSDVVAEAPEREDRPRAPGAVRLPPMRAAQSLASEPYYAPEPTSADELARMRRIDELHRKYPFYEAERCPMPSEGRSRRESPAHPAVDAPHGSRCADNRSRRRAGRIQNTFASLPGSRPRDFQGESGLGDGHHVHADEGRFRAPRHDQRSVLTPGAVDRRQLRQPTSIASMSEWVGRDRALASEGRPRMPVDEHRSSAVAELLGQAPNRARRPP